MSTTGEDSAGFEKGAVGDHWNRFAMLWNAMGPPLRPSDEDMNFCAQTAGEWMECGRAPRVLLLGVTPEVYRLPWPQETDFLAVDHTQAMIDLVWPGPDECVMCADWLDMRLPAASRDIVFCDGGLNLLQYPDQHRRLAESLGEVISDGGLCILRLFVLPPEPEGPATVINDLLAGRVASVNALKLRLWMALKDGRDGVEVRRVWQVVRDAAGDLDALAAKVGWPAESMRCVDAYKDSPARYSLLTVEKVKDIFCSETGCFEAVRTHVPGYELGRLCPTVVLRRSARA